MIEIPVFKDKDKFFFRDSFWDSIYGPFDFEEEALGEFGRYVKSMPFLLDNVKTPCSFCKSTNFETEFDVEDKYKSDRVHIDRCECGAFRTRVDKNCFEKEKRLLVVNGWEIYKQGLKLVTL